MVTDDSCGLEAVTANIIIAYVRNNHLPGAILPDLIRTVHHTLPSLGTTAPPAPESARPTPAEVRKSITPDALISFIDGRPYKTLKRHLTSRGLDACSYRARFGLPADYPMVAASYSRDRSEIAKALGLGIPDRAKAATEQPRSGL
ncbi:MucR family transcriptional regulator [Methylorubrum extorquens]